MWYLLKVYALITAFGLSMAGLMILSLWVWSEANALVAARYRIYRRLATLTTQPRFFANPLAISRTVSGNGR
jgi:hypothetical protein